MLSGRRGENQAVGHCKDDRDAKQVKLDRKETYFCAFPTFLLQPRCASRGLFRLPVPTSRTPQVVGIRMKLVLKF